MFTVHRKELDWGGRKLTLETGRVARQADGAVLATYGETVVLCTAVGAKQPRPGIDFFPLTVNYQEKTFAAGKIPGGFFKREGRPTEKETLTSRLIDRPIRPLFPDGFYNEVQVVATVMSLNPEVDSDIPAMIAVSAALTISGIPFNGPIGACRVGYVNGEYVLNPTASQLKESQLNLVVAGTEDAIMMVEGGAKELTEDQMLEALETAHREIKKIVSLQNDLVAKVGKEKRPVKAVEINLELAKEVTALAMERMLTAIVIPNKMERQKTLDQLLDDARVLGALVEEVGAQVAHARAVAALLGEVSAGREEREVRGQHELDAGGADAGVHVRRLVDRPAARLLHDVVAARVELRALDADAQRPEGFGREQVEALGVE